jgi:hypothetical protein
LTEISEVEWVVHHTEGRWWIRSGERTAVTIDFSSTTKDFIHTHVKIPEPSLDDLRTLRRMRRHGAKVNNVKIICNGEIKIWSLKELEIMKSKNLLKEAK